MIAAGLCSLRVVAVIAAGLCSLRVVTATRRIAACHGYGYDPQGAKYIYSLPCLGLLHWACRDSEDAA